MSLHWAVRAGAEEPGPEGASLWDERGQSAQDLDSPAGAGDARRAGGRRASPQQRGDGEAVPWEGQARGGPASGTEQPDPHPCRAASRNSEERRRGRPQSGTAANLGQGTPSRDRDAQEAHRSSPDAERQRGTPSSRGHRAQRARSCSGPCQGHRSKEWKSYGRRSQAEAGQNRRSVAESGGIRDRFRVHARPPSQHPGSRERSRTGSVKTFLAERKCRRQVRGVELGRCRQQ